MVDVNPIIANMAGTNLSHTAPTFTVYPMTIKNYVKTVKKLEFY